MLHAFGGRCGTLHCQTQTACTCTRWVWSNQGLHVGGLEEINRLLRQGQIQADDVQVLFGCAAWNPGQLANEIWLGCWHVLAASSDVLHECLFGEASSFILTMNVSVVLFAI